MDIECGNIFAWTRMVDIELCFIYTLYACLHVCTYLCMHAMERKASIGKRGLGEIGNGMGGEKNVWICCL